MILTVDEFLQAVEEGCVELIPMERCKEMPRDNMIASTNILDFLFENPDKTPESWRVDPRGFSPVMTVIFKANPRYFGGYYGLAFEAPAGNYYDSFTFRGDTQKPSGQRMHTGFDWYGYVPVFKQKKAAEAAASSKAP